jgi:CRP/FNR family transcriptional regulator
MILQNLQKGGASDNVEVCRQSPCFAHLSEDKLNEIASLATSCYFRRGEFIFRQEEAPLFFHMIKEGRVKLFRQTAVGKNFTISVQSRGETVHSAVLFDGTPRWASAQAMDAVTILRISREEFLAFATRNPIVAMNFTCVLAKQVRRAYGRLIDMIVDRVDQRLVKVLYMLSSKFGTTLYFTAEEVADLTGTTTETTFRVMSQLKNSGIIHTARGKIVILDESRLHSLSADLILA